MGCIACYVSFAPDTPIFYVLLVDFIIASAFSSTRESNLKHDKTSGGNVPPDVHFITPISFTC